MHEVIGVLVNDMSEVGETMYPYDENKEETIRMTESQLREWAAEYINPDDLKKMKVDDIVSQLENESYAQIEKENRADVWHVTIGNTQGMFDWYEIGGRWDKVFAKKNMMPAEEYISLYLEETADPKKLLVHKLNNAPEYIPNAYVTVDDWQEFDSDTAADKARIAEFIRSSGKKLIVFVDKHQ